MQARRLRLPTGARKGIHMTLTLKTAVLTVMLAAAAASLGAADEQKGNLIVMKNCSQYSGNAGDYCTITGSSLALCTFSDGTGTFAGFTARVAGNLQLPTLTRISMACGLKPRD